MRWPWSNRAEMRRMLQAVADANARALKAEEKLDAERARFDKITLNMMDRFFTSQVKTYAISPPDGQPQQSSQQQPLTPFQETEREQWAMFAVEQGYDKEDGYAKWDARQRGELMPYERTN